MRSEMRQCSRSPVNPCKITYFLFRFRTALINLTYICRILFSLQISLLPTDHNHRLEGLDELFLRQNGES